MLHLMVIKGMENNYEDISFVGFCYLIVGANVRLFASEHNLLMST